MMRIQYALMLALFAAPIAVAAAPHSANAASGSAIDDASAAKKKQKTRVQAAPAPLPFAWGGWRPADPSFDQNGRPYQPPPGLSCPVDLGYGRWGSCDDEF